MICQKPKRPHGQTLGIVHSNTRQDSSFPLDVLKHFDCLNEIFCETAVAYLTRIAENLSVPASLLEQLAWHPHPAVREAVADNPNTPEDIMWLLVNDESPDVRYAIAENHNVAMELLLALRDDDNPYVACRAGATIERLTPRAVLEPGFWRYEQRAVG